MTYLLAVLLALAIGWCLGHTTRPEPRRTRACARCDEAAVRADMAAFNAVLAHLDFDVPDDPRNAA